MLEEASRSPLLQEVLVAVRLKVPRTPPHAHSVPEVLKHVAAELERQRDDQKHHEERGNEAHGSATVTAQDGTKSRASANRPATRNTPGRTAPEGMSDAPVRPPDFIQ